MFQSHLRNSRAALSLKRLFPGSESKREGQSPVSPGGSSVTGNFGLSHCNCGRRGSLWRQAGIEAHGIRKAKITRLPALGTQASMVLQISYHNLTGEEGNRELFSTSL